MSNSGKINSMEKFIMTLTAMMTRVVIDIMKALMIAMIVTVLKPMTKKMRIMMMMMVAFSWWS